jgi:hypothetical protein
MYMITVVAEVKVVRWRTLVAVGKVAGQHRPAQPRLRRRTLAAAGKGESGEPDSSLDKN